MTIYNLGNIKGEKGDKGDSVTGPTGPVGVGIKNIEQITYMKFKFCLTDGSEYIINYGDEPTFDGISVSSSKDILSYADGDSTVLSAQLTNGGQAVSVSGESVTFEVRKVSDDSLVETLTDTTDSTGLASVEYFGKGVGDLYVKCQCRSLTKTYEVQDCGDYQAMTDNSKQSHWTIPSAVTSSSTFGYSSNGWKFGNASSYSVIELNNSISFPCVIEFYISNIENSNNYQPTVVLKDGSTTIIALNGRASNNTTFMGDNINISTNGSTLVRIELNTNEQKLYFNDVLKSTKTKALPSTSPVEFHTGSNRWVEIKDFKIKPL